MRTFIAFLTGALFAAGLVIAGMTQPENVIGFLNLAGEWNPAIAFVMIGAIPVHFAAYRLIKHRASPIFDVKWHVPTSREITTPLILGSVIFGAGWAIGGLCPGPALAAMMSGQPGIYVYLITMFAGMAVARNVQKRMG